MEVVRRTPLFELHRRLGARMTAFGGFEMPLAYAGIIDEHLAVRSHAGIFDLSHMGEFELAGAAAAELLERAMTNSASRLQVGQAHYTLMCTPDGGTIDDLIVYRVDDARFMLCVNAANIAADREWLLELGAADAGFRDLGDETGLVAVQGPQAEPILADLADKPLAQLRRFALTHAAVAGVRCIAARTGYTGEDGFELFAPANQAEKLFSAILEAGAPRGLVPCGLGARDTLRLEAGLALYGHELDRATSPLEAGLSAFVRFGRDFIGEEALAAQRREGPKRRLAGIRTQDGRSVARQGYGLFLNGREIGKVTSGTFAPTFGRPLAMAYLDSASGTPASVDVEIRTHRVAAAVVPLPFYRRGKTSQQ
jgi:aminomethyltransferase